MSKKEKCAAKKLPERLNKVGGQAVLDGVMMKAGSRVVTTCRKANGTLSVTDSSFSSVRKKNKLLNVPILRGVINFVEMLLLSYHTLSVSADELDLDGEKKDGEDKSSTTTLVMVIGIVLGVLLAMTLFIFLPGLISDGIAALVGLLGVTLSATWKAVIEGAAKILIFIAYLSLVSLMPDIKRTFMYHGAEHKSIACFEAGDELTPERARNYTRLHPRCGTSYMFVMILLGIAVGILVNNLFPTLNRFALTGIRLLILPLVMGLGYEFIMLAGKHDNFLTRALSAPGLWMQNITTKEPTEEMLEVAITSIKCALRDDYPEFKEFYESRGWEPAPLEDSTNECDAKAAGESEENVSAPDAPEENGELCEGDSPADGKTDEAV